MRGDVYRLKAPRDLRGHEQAGPRLAVVVQSEDWALSTWIIAPTSTGAAPSRIRPEVEVGGQRTRVVVDQLTAVDPEYRLGDLIAHLSLAEMQAVDRALLMVLALD